MSNAPPAHTPATLKFKLSLMMFLQFVIWGAWFEIGFSYIPNLGFPEPWMTPLVFGAFNIGALVALFFSTQFADRNYSAENFLSFSHLIGGLAIMGLFFLHPEGDQKAAFWPFFRIDAFIFNLLCADDLDHQLHRLRSDEGSAERVGPSGCGVPSAGLSPPAVHFHSC